MGQPDLWSGYDATRFYDEMLAADHTPRDGCDGVMRYLRSLGPELVERQAAADLAIRSMGVSFAVYSDGENIDRAWPFDVVPRVISTREWDRVSRGLIQRLEALNLFIDDLYHDAKVIADGVFSQELLDDSVNFRPECVGVDPPQGCLGPHLRE